MSPHPSSLLPGALRVLWLICMLAAGTIAAQERVDDHLMRGRAALNDGRFADAIAILSQGLEQHPRNAELLLLRAQANEARGDYLRALADYELSLELRPDLAAAQSGLYRVRQRAEAGPRAALEANRRRVEASPGNLTYRLQYADALREAGILEEAADQYEAYLRRTQGTPAVVRNYLISLAGTAQHQRGAAEAQRFLRTYPTSSDLWMRLGYFRLWQGNARGAEMAFREAVAHDRRNEEARRGLQMAERQIAQSAPRAGDRGAIIERLQQQLATGPDQPDLRFRLADELMRAGRLAEAFSELQLLEPEHGRTERWRQAFRAIDERLPADAGIYRVDRLAYRLALDPANLQTRYELVDALATAHRYAEAHAVLEAGGRYAGAGDPYYQQHLARLARARLAHAREQQALLAARLASDPRDQEAARGLVATFPVLLDTDELPVTVDEARALFQRLLAARPDDVEVRFQYAQFLTRTGEAAAAVEQSEHLLRRDPEDPLYIAQYIYAAIQQTPPPASTEGILLDGLRRHPDNATLLLAAVTFYTSTAYLDPARLEDAARYLLQAEAVGAPDAEVLARRDAIENARNYQILVAARAHAEAGRYREAIRMIEHYYEITGDAMPREVLLELGQYAAEAQDRDRAITLIEEALAIEYTSDAALTLFRFLFDEGRYPAARAVAEDLIALEPHHGQARLLYGDVLRELFRYDEAEVAYRMALAVGDPFTRADAEERLLFLEQITGFGVGRGFMVAPRIDAVIAGGDGLRYRRFAPGVDLQASVPDVPLTVTAGYRLHRISGSDLAIPGQAVLLPWYSAHEVTVGAIIDATPPVRTQTFTGNYTNRFVLEAGIIDYPSFQSAIRGLPDSRTARVWSARYHHQSPEVFRASAGLRQTEGALDLWAAVGPSIGLRLLQADVQASAAPLDTLLRISGRLAINRVSHTNATFIAGRPVALTGEIVTNWGLTMELKAGYRITPQFYGGAMYHRIEYADPSPFYFTPTAQPYELYEVFAEYETVRTGQHPHVRLLGALGTVAYSSFLSRRVEADVVYPVRPNVALGLNARLSEAARSFAGGEFSRYTIVVVGGAAYISF